MTPPPLSPREAARHRAARRLLDPDRVEAPAPDGAEDAAAQAEMERLWSVTGVLAGDPRLRAAIDADLARYPPLSRLRRFAPIAAALVLTLAGGGTIGWLGLADAPPRTAEAAPPSAATEVGQRKRLVLADSSSVALDTDSAIAVRIDAALRAVTLQRGRAFFRVTKDPARPFVVTAGDKRVRAVGTAFEVRLDGGEVIVTVTEGVVEVTERTESRRPAHTARVDAGTQLVALARNDWAIHRIDPELATSWMRGRLSFVDEPLERAVAEMNRYTRQKLVFRDGVVPDARILGVFRAGDTQALAQAIELNGSARIVATQPDRIEVMAR